MQNCSFHLFEKFGVELEYMIVDSGSLAILPISEKIMVEADGLVSSEIEKEAVSWSNELVSHLLELKVTEPVAAIEDCVDPFQQNVREINRLLRPLQAKLLPTAMHPFMDPARETVIWRHEYSEIYQRYNSIFGCSTHGWANIQSVHLNLPFADENEFAKLHAALRLVLPLLPAFAASSPVVDGKSTSYLDNRLVHYKTHTARVPSLTGKIIPEAIFSEAAYQHDILDKIYSDLAPLDPGGILRHEFANARGAIARFDRGSIEVRLLDMQECPLADAAMCVLTAELVKALVDERWSPTARQQKLSTDELGVLLNKVVSLGPDADIEGREYLSCFGVESSHIRGGTLIERLIENIGLFENSGYAKFFPVFDLLISRGPLARRMLDSLDDEADHRQIAALYHRLAECLDEGRLFIS